MSFVSKFITTNRKPIKVTTDMNDVQILPLTNYRFNNNFETRFARVYSLSEEKIVICELKSEYVPIAHFKDMFYQISDLIKSGLNRKFIFDKRSLRAFHQPSMEWYYIDWKRDMLALGLKTHRKILPPEPWFQKSVAIAKDQIHQHYPDNVIDQLDIRYCDSVEEAIVV